MAERSSLVQATSISSGTTRSRVKRQLLGSATKIPFGAMFCAALVRLIVALFRYKYLAAPTLEHGDFGAEMGWVARSLALHLGFSSPFYPQSGPTALVPPIFPFVLSLVFRVGGLYTPVSAFAILVLQIACSVLTCIPISLLGRRLYGQRAGHLATWIWAFYPFSIYYSAGEIWDYALTALLSTGILTLLLSLKSNSHIGLWLITGLLLGIGGLTNPSILPAAFLLSLFPMLAKAPERRRAFLKGTALLLTTALVLLPWSIRNERRLGAWIPVRDGFWLEAWAGNHGDSFVTNPASAHPASSAAEMALFLNQGELRYIAGKKTLTTIWIGEHPRSFVRITFRRVLRFWTGFWSLEPAYLKKEPFDIPACLLCTSITALMFRGLGKLRKEGVSSFWSMALVLFLFPCPYYVTHASMDYRQPIEPLVVILISIGLVGRRSISARPWIQHEAES